MLGRNKLPRLVINAAQIHILRNEFQIIFHLEQSIRKPEDKGSYDSLKQRKYS